MCVCEYLLDPINASRRLLIQYNHLHVLPLNTALRWPMPWGPTPSSATPSTRRATSASAATRRRVGSISVMDICIHVCICVYVCVYVYVYM